MSRIDEAIAVVHAGGCIAYCMDEDDLEEQVSFYHSKGWKTNVFMRTEMVLKNVYEESDVPSK